MSGDGGRFADDDRGATPMRVAAEANSAAHHAVDELREFRREQALRNQSLETKIDAALAVAVAATSAANSIAVQLGTIRWMVGLLCASVAPAAVAAGSWLIGRLLH